MNSYQRLAVFLARLVGIVIAVRGVLALLLFVQSRWVNAKLSEGAQLMFSFDIALWIIGGVMLVLFAKPIGQALGRDLD